MTSIPFDNRFRNNIATLYAIHVWHFELNVCPMQHRVVFCRVINAWFEKLEGVGSAIF